MVRIVPHLELCAFNRRGSFTAFGAFDSNAFGTDRWTQINVWERIARGESTRNVLDDICALLHLQVPSPLPATTPASLTYRVITAMLRTKTFSPVRWCCLNGVLDSSGFEGCEIRRELFAPFPAVKAPSNSEVHISSSFAFGLPLFFRIRPYGISQAPEQDRCIQGLKRRIQFRSRSRAVRRLFVDKFAQRQVPDHSHVR
jgi:hypothetical protein